MKKTLTWILAVALVLALPTALTGCKRKVTVTTGEIVICTSGEVIEDNTEEIEVPEDEVADYGVTTKVITCETHSRLASLYDEAQAAIAAGDLTTARERLATILESDPGYRKAKDQLDAIDAGTTPEVDGGEATGGTGDTTTGDTGDTDEPTGPVASLTVYVPDVIDGYVAQGIIADAGSLSRRYLPNASGADQLVIEVEQQVDAASAEATLGGLLNSYPESQSESTIAGHRVVVGSNGQYAIAVFTDGALVIAVELHSTGASGAGLIDAALAVVQSITS